MALSHSEVTDENGTRSLIVILSNGDVVNVVSNHANYDRILEEVVSDQAEEDRVRELADVETALNDFISNVVETGNVRVESDQVFFQNKPVTGVLVHHLLRLYSKSDTSGVASLSKFLEKALGNPGGIKSVDSLWSWMRERNFTITDSGNFVAYKGVTVLDDGSFASVHAGDAYVDGKFYKNANIPNPVGAVVTMERKKVNANTKEGCSTGLHAGTWRYASSFGRVTLAVEINPEDVVSVPDDCNFQKLRVCKYKVLSVVQSRMEESEDDKEGYW